MRSKSRTKDLIGPLKNQNGELIIDDKESCQVLNEYFSSVFTIENTANLHLIGPKVEHIFTGDQHEMLNDFDITPEIVYDKLCKLLPNKAPGVDNLSPRVLKETARSICKPLAMIFIKSLNEGAVPTDWKRTNVTAIYKKGSKASSCNYRPISLTSQICKVMDSIVRDHMTQHLKKFNLIRDTYTAWLCEE